MGSGWSVRANRQMSRLLGGIVGGGYIYINMRCKVSFKLSVFL